MNQEIHKEPSLAAPEEEVQQQSPRPEEVEATPVSAHVDLEDKGKLIVHMSFTEAIEKVIEGKKITRLEWPNKDEYGLLKDGFLKIYRNGQFHNWLVSDGDLEGEDWVVLP